jgi:hypothetical protein
MSLSTTLLHQTLQDHGALELKTLDTPNLDNPIHPLFNWPNWDSLDLSDEAWIHFKPVLQLASLFITEPAILEFWFHAIYGNLERDNLERKVLIINSVQFKYLEHYATQYLNSLVDTIRFGFAQSEFDTSISSMRLYYKVSLHNSQLHIRDLYTYLIRFTKYCPIIPRRPSTVTIKDDIHTSRTRVPIPSNTSTIKSLKILLPQSYLRQFQLCGALTAGHRLRFQFFVAVSLVHELANTITRLRFPIESAKGDVIWYYPRRDIFDGTPGMAWEREIFQGMIVQQTFLTGTGGISDVYACSAGLVLDRGIYTPEPNTPEVIGDDHDYDLPPPYSATPIHPSSSKMVILKMDWVNQWFRKDTWEGISADQSLPVFTPDTWLHYGTYMGSDLSQSKKYIICPTLRSEG